MTLGEFIGRLEKFDQGATIHAGSLDSYRGIYTHLALEPNGSRAVVNMLKEAREAIGHTFTGYKGGEFTMGVDTPIWVAEYGESGNQALVDLEVKNDGIHLMSYDIMEYMF